MRATSTIAACAAAAGQATVPEEARSGVTAISAGLGHSLALKDGRVLAWGLNDSGQATVPPEAESGVTAIAAGLGHSLAIKDGRVLSWGNGATGLLEVPTEALSEVSAISTSGSHSLALKNGRVVEWGSAGPKLLDAPAEALTGIVAVSAGGAHSLMVKADITLVLVEGVRTEPTKIVAVGRTTGVPLGTLVSPFVRQAGTVGAFEPREPFPLSYGDETEGRFRYRQGELEPNAPYEVYVEIGGIRSNTIVIGP